MKKLSTLNKLLVVIFALATIILAIAMKDYLILLYLLVLPIPFILKIKPALTFCYLIFTCISILLGSLCHLFKLTVWFDSLSHFVWGILSSLMAIYILDKMKMYDEKKIFFNIVFIFIFSLATSGFWEICEFTVDNVLGSNTQRVETGTFDTMKDIIVALIANIIFLMWYAYEYMSNHKLAIRKFVEVMDKE